MLDEKVFKKFIEDNNVGTAYYESVNKPFRKVYVDMEMLFDYRLTAYLSLLKNEEEYEYMKTCLPAYKLFKGRELKTVFPQLPYTTSDALELMRDKEFQYYLSMKPLITTISNVLPIQLTVMTDTNYKNPTYDKKPIEVYLVNQLFPISLEAQRNIVLSLTSIIDNISIKFVHGFIPLENPEILSGSDLCLIYDIKEFLIEESTTTKALCLDNYFINGSVIADFRLEDSSPFITEDSKILFSNTEKVLNHFTYFYFIDRYLLQQLK